MLQHFSPNENWITGNKIGVRIWVNFLLNFRNMDPYCHIVISIWTICWVLFSYPGEVSILSLTLLLILHQFDIKALTFQAHSHRWSLTSNIRTVRQIRPLIQATWAWHLPHDLCASFGSSKVLIDSQCRKLLKQARLLSED